MSDRSDASLAILLLELQNARLEASNELQKARLTNATLILQNATLQVENALLRQHIRDRMEAGPHDTATPADIPPEHEMSDFDRAVAAAAMNHPGFESAFRNVFQYPEPTGNPTQTNASTSAQQEDHAFLQASQPQQEYTEGVPDMPDVMEIGQATSQ
ncbi:uncharacterized protein STEHIDRAFT_160745 [Stereum hirsutum FP-91666 SS1]|uniref:uncharacterized protein n=1 Tax=Stereum hirsutum (strain FP-91666) TaxID=721885 RepID=UPI000444A79F|nr:uncharacterized protein STEHIDRAFT_160745 [Stereum hirsutum FP-91666 SS1]EIM83146.1 hypothetical protein STEHIDRAFT_160745 [Stereum hirsutum FP-91666 SS1]